MESVVLLLNADYEPLNVCDVRRAFRLVFGEKAEVIEYDHAEIAPHARCSGRPASSGSSTTSAGPGRASASPGARSSLATGTPASTAASQSHDLTLDHVVPRHRGGSHTWDNLVAACKPCNHRKGGKMPDEARMRPLRAPYEPRCDVYTQFTPYLADPRNDGLAGLPVPARQLSGRGYRRTRRRPDGSRPFAASSPRMRWARSSERLLGGRPCRLPRGRWRCATRCWAARPMTGTSPPTRARRRSWACSRRASTRTGSGRCWRTAWRSTTFRRDHHYADHRRPGQRHVHGRGRRRTCCAATSRSTRSPGAARAGARPDEAGVRGPRPAGAPTSRRASCGPWASRRRASTRMRCGCCAPRGSPRPWASRIEPATLAAMRRHADDVRWVSGERVGIELRRMVEAERTVARVPDPGRPACCGRVFPELAAQIGIPQAKLPGQDCFDHTLATLDAAARSDPGDERMLLAALLHDVGKPATMDHGHFHGHETVGAVFAEALLGRVAYPRREATADRPDHRAAHMFVYTPDWSDAAVRRFIRRVGPDVVDDVLRLRRADNVGSGWPPDDGERSTSSGHASTAQRAAGVPLVVADLAVDGTDLMAELGRPGGPWLGEPAGAAAGFGHERPARATPGASCWSTRAAGWTQPPGPDAIRVSRITLGPGPSTAQSPRGACRCPGRSSAGTDRPRDGARVTTDDRGHPVLGGARAQAAAGYASGVIEMLLQADRLLTVDMVDQADAIYRRVAEADPQQCDRGGGHGALRAGREDDHEAYRLAARALTIDPQNDMARRMEARLAEVLSTRGESPGSGPPLVGGDARWRHWRLADRRPQWPRRCSRRPPGASVAAPPSVGPGPAPGRRTDPVRAGPADAGPVVTPDPADAGRGRPDADIPHRRTRPAPAHAGASTAARRSLLDRLTRAMSMRVLVTGGAGYVGSVTAERLHRRRPRRGRAGHAGHRPPRRACPLAPAFVQAQRRRPRDRDAMLLTRRAHRRHPPLRRARLVGQSMEDPRLYYRENVVGGIALLDAARDAGVDRMVFSSTAAVYGAPEQTPAPRGRPAPAGQPVRRDASSRSRARCAGTASTGCARSPCATSTWRARASGSGRTMSPRRTSSRTCCGPRRPGRR